MFVDGIKQIKSEVMLHPPSTAVGIETQDIIYKMFHF